MDVAFACEPVTDGLCKEIFPLLERHWTEIAHYKDIPLRPNFEEYKKRGGEGSLVCYTMRKNGDLIGYAVFFIAFNMHYGDSKQANQDVVFLEPEYRRERIGAKFLEWCDAQLADLDVQVVAHHVKTNHPALGRVLEQMGYKHIDSIYAKRLDDPRRLPAELLAEGSS